MTGVLGGGGGTFVFLVVYGARVGASPSTVSGKPAVLHTCTDSRLILMFLEGLRKVVVVLITEEYEYILCQLTMRMQNWKKYISECH